MSRLLVLFFALTATAAFAADTTIRVDAHYDAASKTTQVATRTLVVPLGKNFVDPSAAVVLIGSSVTADGTESSYLDVTYTSNGWRYLAIAVDVDAVTLPLTVLDRRVAGQGKTMEHVSVALTRAYLEAHADNGLAIHLQGKEGEALVKVPAIFVHDFLITLNENRPGKAGAVMAVEKIHFGAQVVPLQAPFARILGLTAAQGLLVVNVAPDSMAGKAGLQQGDILLGIGTTSLATEADLQQAVDSAATPASLSLQIWRGGSRSTLQAQ